MGAAERDLLIGTARAYVEAARGGLEDQRRSGALRKSLDVALALAAKQVGDNTDAQIELAVEMLLRAHIGRTAKWLVQVAVDATSTPPIAILPIVHPQPPQRPSFNLRSRKR